VHDNLAIAGVQEMSVHEGHIAEKGYHEWAMIFNSARRDLCNSPRDNTYADRPAELAVSPFGAGRLSSTG
jgi:hypothetical protein